MLTLSSVMFPVLVTVYVYVMVSPKSALERVLGVLDKVAELLEKEVFAC